MKASLAKYFPHALALLFGGLVLPLLIGVWTPDILFANKHTLASARLRSGYTFRVVQYWNRTDFYSTELHVISPDGNTFVYTLDGDDRKRWRVPLAINGPKRIATVTIGKTTRHIAW